MDGRALPDPTLKRRPPGLTPYEVMFPLATIGSIVAVVASYLAFEGTWMPPRGFAPHLWHAHEMLLGHFPMAFGGVVLTGLPRWTKGDGVPASTTLGLALLWLAARAAMLTGWPEDPRLLAAIAAAFPFGLAWVAGSRIFAARDRRDYGIVGLLGLVGIADALYLLDVGDGSDGAAALRLALAMAATGAMVMGGRIIPALTRHLAGERGIPVPPPTPKLLDHGAVGLGAVAVLTWVASPEGGATAVLLAAAAMLHGLRWLTWRGWTTLDWPPFLALHAGYAFLPGGLALLAASIVLRDPGLLDGAIHAWGAGVFGLMCLAVLASVLRRYSGRGLSRDPASTLLFAALFAAAMLRLSAAFDGGGLSTAALALWGMAQTVFLGVILRDRRSRRVFLTAPAPPGSPAS